ncbi:hypothetical protein ABZ725_45935 [Streptomyces sp. NPDC006872]|uniref:hypothetical protein n=1 Tax=Streptomyces sp. NPDC006872 TaxID=3155720 RepID=UPI0033EEB935
MAEVSPVLAGAVWPVVDRLSHILAAGAGHTNAAFTKRKYVHVDVEDMRAAATAWDTFHGGGIPSGREKDVRNDLSRTPVIGL